MGIPSRTRAHAAKRPQPVDALFTATQRKVLGVLLSAPPEGLFGNQILSAAQAGNGAVQRELARLIESGVVAMEESGGRKRYRLSPGSSAYGPLQQMFRAPQGQDPVRRVAEPTGTYAVTSNRAPVPRALRRLPINLPEIEALCRAHHIVRLAFFGSVTRDDFGPASDVDVLVEFADGETTADGLIAVQEMLQARTGRKVDVLTPAVFRNPHRRASIERDLQDVYLAS